MTDKAIVWVGSALDDLITFPPSARRNAGFQLRRVQEGIEPDDWKPFGQVGPGVYEIRLREAAGAYRVLYVCKFKSAVYVLHCFQKKTQKTTQADIAIAGMRYRELTRLEGLKR